MRTWSACSSGKYGFGDQDEAERALGRARMLRSNDPERGRTPGRKERKAYQCKACRYWHLSSRAGKQRRGSYR